MDGWPTDAEWQSWLADHGSKFWFYARQKTRSDADAEDLMQEAILEAVERNTEAGPPPPPLVFATMHRRAIDWARREQRRAAREFAASETSDSLWFDTGVEDRERARLIQDAMGKLPEIYREVVTLKVWAGLTFAEIADSLGIPANTAASRYRYGLQELRKLTKEIFT
jgi:RNA polymerase sigma-70 factor (ECF subfamily)